MVFFRDFFLPFILLLTRRTLVTVVRGDTVEERSYIKICRAIINPQDELPLAVVETREICSESWRPTQALLTIFLSTLLADVAKKDGLDITYTHNCNTDAVYGYNYPKANVQNKLPPQIVMMQNSHDFPLEKVTSICREVLTKLKKYGMEKTSPSHLLHYTVVPRRRRKKDSPNHPITVMHYLLPTIKNALQYIASISHESDYQSWIFLETYAVIYLSCQSQLCNDPKDDTYPADGNLYHVYAHEIPLHVKKIDIIASPAFANAYADYGGRLRDWMERIYPRAQEVSYYVGESHFRSYSRIMKAKYSVCRGMLCSLPALSTSNFASIIKEMRPSWWMDGIPLPSNIKIVTADFGPSSCIQLRGRYGNWEKDMELAPKLQYSKEPAEYIDPATTYKWVEKSFPMCPVNLLSREKLCKVLHELEVTRIFLLGDSLTREMAYSFWKIIFKSNNAVPMTRPDIRSSTNPYYARIRNNDWDHIIQCPPPIEHHFHLTFLRNDFINDVDIGLEGDHLALPWVDKYLEYKGRTIFVANAGAHIHEISSFQRVFDQFVDTVDSLGRDDDIVFFRPNIPGHKMCHLYEEPYDNYPQFEKVYSQIHDSRYDKYSWDLFFEYNDFASRTLSERNRRGGAKEINILNTFDMGVLRPDGHLYPQIVPALNNDGKNQDCLHSRLPGPTDWWNHMLYSNLESLSMDKKGASLNVTSVVN